ncbi:MAG TPA: GTPase HflX [Gammaproteobacteria bacterium]|nr:GTPase HflX [Gammaproteobacteria bacterium]
MFERHEGGERALLVQVNFNSADSSADSAELEELTLSTGAQIAGIVHTSRKAADARFFVGTGKVEEITAAVAEKQVDVVIFNHPLSPSQERNLEAEIHCRVLDRTTLILDIFAQRARSHEGKLQVELAQLKHMSTRLIRGWTHLERQKGGIGMRGPGEKQLETDRRLLNERIKAIQGRLDKVKVQRNQGRQARRKAEIPTVSLVGYTNAGKSTLFNALSGAEVYAADQLFATLDPTLRRVQLPGGLNVVLADTVGFIRQLPHDLVVAFRATLQETEEADLLLHIVDASDPERDDNIQQVNNVLKEISADKLPQLMVFNKIDLTELKPRAKDNAEGEPDRVWLSAKSGEGIKLLIDQVSQFFQGEVVRGKINLPMNAGQLRAELFEKDVVVNEKVTDEGFWNMEVCLPHTLYQQLKHRYEEMPQLDD